MTRNDFAAELEAIAVLIVELPGVSRRNPHLFAERKSELAGRLRRRAIELRTQLHTQVGAPAGPRAAMAPGVRKVGQRQVRVEVRRAAG